MSNECKLLKGCVRDTEISCMARGRDRKGVFGGCARLVVFVVVVVVLMAGGSKTVVAVMSTAAQ